jgi:hypothetical protein
LIYKNHQMPPPKKNYPYVKLVNIMESKVVWECNFFHKLAQPNNHNNKHNKTKMQVLNATNKWKVQNEINCIWLKIVVMDCNCQIANIIYNNNHELFF